VEDGAIQEAHLLVLIAGEPVFDGGGPITERRDWPYGFISSREVEIEQLDLSELQNLLYICHIFHYQCTLFVLKISHSKI
jgi:hypothetical protein